MVIVSFAVAGGARADYPAEVLADNPIAYWRLDEADGSSIADSSGNGHDGAADGTAGTISYGEPGLLPTAAGNGSIRLAGLDRILVPGFDKIGPTGYSAEYWIRLDQLPAGFLNLVGDGAAGGTFFMMNYTNASGIIRPHYSFANAPVSLDAAAGTLAPGPVYHVVTTWDAANPSNNNGKIFVNGVLVQQGNVSGNPDPANESHPVFIGTDNREATAANFTIDEVALYDFPLSTERVVAHFTAGTGGVAPPMNYAEEVLLDAPTAYWRLGETTGPTAADSSGNGHHATADAGVAFGQASLIPPNTDTAITLSGDPRLSSAGFEKVDSGFSVEFWTAFSSAPAGGGFASLVGDAESANDFNLFVQAGPAGIVRAHVQTDLGTVAVDSPTSLADGRLHHVVSTWQAASGELRLYIDNFEVATANRSGTAANTDNPIFIGRDGSGPGSFDGSIDEVAIYDFPLSPERIAAHFNWVDVPPPPRTASGVEVGASTLIGELDYSDSFTIGDRAPTSERQSYPAQAFPLPFGVELVEDAHGNAPTNWPSNAWSIATDAAVNPGATGYPGGSGSGSETGMTQRGGGGDWSIPYGRREVFVVQSDFIQLDDRVDFTVGATPGNIFGAGNLSIFFRKTAHPSFPEIGIFNGSSETDTGLTSGISDSVQWYNYALLVDVPNQTIEAFVNEESRGVIDLATIGGGAYAGILNNAFVGIGGAGNDRLWSDNFQVGAPGGPAAAFAITAFAFNPETAEIALTWNSSPNRSYILQASLDLGTWVEINDGIDSGGQTTSHTENLSDRLPVGKDAIFFRIVEFEP